MMTKLIVDIVASSGLVMAIPLKRRSLMESTFPRNRFRISPDPVLIFRLPERDGD
jgi:hypothetical protein